MTEPILNYTQETESVASSSISLREGFRKDVRAYLTEASEYDITRIVQLFEKHSRVRVVTKTLKKVEVRTQIIYKTVPARLKMGNKENFDPVFSPEDILKLASDYFKIPIEKIVKTNKGANGKDGKKRKNRMPHEMIRIRRCICYLMYTKTSANTYVIGDILGIDRTSVSDASSIIASSLMSRTSYAVPDVKNMLTLLDIESDKIKNKIYGND